MTVFIWLSKAGVGTMCLNWITLEHRSLFVFSECMHVSFVPRLNSEVPSSTCLRDEMIWLQQNLSKLGSPVVLCHNDLLCKNIIYNQKEGESYKPQQLPWATAFVSPTPLPKVGFNSVFSPLKYSVDDLS